MASTTKRTRAYRQSKRNIYRSGFENGVAQAFKNAQETFEYEPEKIEYTITATYLVDFICPGKPKYLFEAKGYFRQGDTRKYKGVQQALLRECKGRELIFILMKPNRKVRKNGKITMSEWCDKHGFQWCTIDTLGLLLDGYRV